MGSEHKELVSKLEKLFGRFDTDHKRFEQANNSIIARDLGYSDSQFSRLINGSATEGEYQRALQNVDRILTVNRLEEQLSKSGSRKTGKNYVWKIVAFVSFSTSIVILLISGLKGSANTADNWFVNRDHTLKWAFESSFINPYVKLDDLPADCNYPCYKYQGKWNLEKSYKLPFFRERNGFHYVATEVEMYARCMVEKSDEGDIVEGYEYQKHEIWYDKREWPIDSFMVSKSGNTTSEYYQNLDLNNEPNFVKIANIHTFFRNEFSLTDSTIHRVGKTIGRDMERIPREELIKLIPDEDKLNAIDIEISKIVTNRLQDFSVPIKCQDARLIDLDVTNIKDGDKMGFDCQLTTSGFPMDYTKTYVLTDQYIKNNCSKSVTN